MNAWMDFGRAEELARLWGIVLTILLVALPLALANAATATDPARNGRVLFVSQRGEALAYPNIYSVSPRGGKAVLVARRAQLPVVSRDGLRLAFVRNLEIVVVDVAHPAREHVLVRGGRGLRSLDDLSWAPAGEALAYTTMRTDGRRALWVKKRGGRGPLRVAVLDGDLDTAADPTWSRDGKEIAFARAVRVGDGYRVSLAIANLMSGRVRAVPRTGGGTEPSWSPDGRRIAFVATTRTRDVLTLIRPDGSDRRRLAPGACNPEWSPDGARLAVSECGGGPGGVGVVLLGKAGVRWLTRSGFEGSWDARGAWIVGWLAGDLVALDPDTVGRRRVLKARTKVFALQAERPATVRSSGHVLFSAIEHPRGRTGLYTVAAAGSSVRPFGAIHPDQPAWAPDGRLLAVVLKEQVAIVDARGSLQRILTHGFSPAWSPDGTKIAFARDVDAGETFDPHLFVIPSRGGESRELGSGADPSWAPLGDRIVVGRGDGELWAYPVDGSAPSQVTHVADPSVRCPSASASDPAWSPDGRKIVFVQTWANCFNRGVERLAVLDLATAVTRTLIRGRESELELAPTWSPDGRFVAYEDHIGNDYATIARVRSDGTGHRVLYNGPGEAFNPTWAPE